MSNRTVYLEIDKDALGNQAFVEGQGHEIARVIGRAADHLDAMDLTGEDERVLLDTNGNRAGLFGVTGKAADAVAAQPESLFMTVSLGNAAMSEREDVRRLLDGLKDKMDAVSMPLGFPEFPSSTKIGLFDVNGNRVGWFENRIDDSPAAKGRALYDLVTDWMGQGEPDADEVARHPQATAFFEALGNYTLDHVEEHKTLPMGFEYEDNGVSLDIEDGGKLFAIMHWAADHDLDPNTNLNDAIDMHREAMDDMTGGDGPDRPSGPSM